MTVISLLQNAQWLLVIHSYQTVRSDCRKHFTKLCILIKPQDIKYIEWQSQRYRIRHGFSHLLLISYKPLCFLSLPCFPPPSSLKHISKLCTRKSADLNSESLGTNQMVQCLQTFKWVLAPKEKKKKFLCLFQILSNHQNYWIITSKLNILWNLFTRVILNFDSSKPSWIYKSSFYITGMNILVGLFIITTWQSCCQGISWKDWMQTFGFLLILMGTLSSTHFPSPCHTPIPSSLTPIIPFCFLRSLVHSLCII